MQKWSKVSVRRRELKSAGVGVYQILRAKQAFRDLMYVLGSMAGGKGYSCVSEGESTKAGVTFEMHAWQ